MFLITFVMIADAHIALGGLESSVCLVYKVDIYKEMKEEKVW